MKMRLERLMEAVSPPHFVPLNILLCFHSFVLQKCLMTLADNAASAAVAAALTVRRGADGAKVRKMEMNELLQIPAWNLSAMFRCEEPLCTQILDQTLICLGIMNSLNSSDLCWLSPDHQSGDAPRGAGGAAVARSSLSPPPPEHYLILNSQRRPPKGRIKTSPDPIQSKEKARGIRQRGVLINEQLISTKLITRSWLRGREG